MGFRQTTEQADRKMFNADAVIRCMTRFAGQEQGLDSEVTTQVDLAILQQYHPCNLPRWRRRKSTASSHMVAQTDLMDGPASTASGQRCNLDGKLY